jgi:ABC-type glutathione transport system ATPase component
MNPELQNNPKPVPLRVLPPRPIHRHIGHSATISLRGVEQSFTTRKGPRLIALDNINLEIKPGEFVCIVGPSGCGKTSLLHLIAGLAYPSSGEVQVNNRTVEGPGSDRMLIFQEHGLFPWLTVGQNVEFGMKMKGIPKRQRREEKAWTIICGWCSFRKVQGQLHSSTLRRHAPAGGDCARALATEPERAADGRAVSRRSIHRRATCCMTSWSASGARPDAPSSLSRTMCARRCAWATAWC